MKNNIVLGGGAFGHKNKITMANKWINFLSNCSQLHFIVTSCFCFTFLNASCINKYLFELFMLQLEASSQQ